MGGLDHYPWAIMEETNHRPRVFKSLVTRHASRLVHKGTDARGVTVVHKAPYHSME